MPSKRPSPSAMDAAASSSSSSPGSQKRPSRPKLRLDHGRPEPNPRSCGSHSGTPSRKSGHACSDEDELFGAAVGASPSRDRSSECQATPTASSASPRRLLPPCTRNRAGFDYSERMI
ncbi:hypothetical protein BRADI_1g77955v3 [Brachypodium distachyon]|uniref:Uncharacterized protein n=1 Tax=Brachypodium distachyon TaxID=15368 RepID=A0A2K2DVP5_BRADI|nr:hypothetical protein BRADI_1g77955v3 [Brachypodium distachyon]